MVLPKHYFKSALTNFKRNKWYTSLMVFSLAAGMFCFILASSYINFEYSRNDSHEHADRVYQLTLKVENRKVGRSLTAGFANRLKSINPNIESVNLLDHVNTIYLSANGQDYLEEDKVFYSKGDLFDVFTFPLKYGNAKTALEGNGKVIISSQLAEVLYQGINPVGEELIVHEKGTFLVSGVLAEVSSKTLIYPSVVFPAPQFSAEENEMAIDNQVGQTHIRIAEGANIEEVRASLYENLQNVDPDDMIEEVLAEPLSEAYWGYSRYDYPGNHYSLTGSSKSMIKTIGYISFGILICAFVGYLSLALGLSLKRSKEIGIRKVNGAGKSDIRFQLLSESVFYSLLSLLISIIGLELFSPSFSALFGVPIGLAYGSPNLLIGLILFAVCTGLLAGAYPAIVVSRLNPVKVLSGYTSKIGAGFRLKQGLLVVQFVMTVCLLFLVFGQHLQVRKMQSFDFGFQKEGIIAFELMRNENVVDNFESVLSQIKEIDGVGEVTGGPFPASFNGFSSFQFDRGDTLLSARVSKIYIQDNFFEVMNVGLSDGETFLKSNIPLARSCIINKPFADLLGAEAVGLTLSINGKPRTVVGVVDQYVDLGINHFGSDPRLFLVSEEPAYHSLLIAHDTEKTADIIAQLDGVWRNYENVVPAGITNLLDLEDGATSSLMKSTKLFTFLAGMLLVLALLNLLGVSLSFAAGEIKNISIRRILGAETIRLFLRLLWPFFKALIMALLIALPLSYWFMEDYLADYTVRIDLTALQGVIVSVTMAFIVLLIIGYQMFRVSNINPVDTLKEG